MRFQVVSDPRARSAACHGLIRAAARGRTATVSALAAAAACGLVITACGSQSAPEAASSASTGACRQLSAGNQHHRHRSSGQPAPAATSNSPTTSHAVCRMSGWPAVIARTAAGGATRLRHRNRRCSAPALHFRATVITLRPGDSAYAVIGADDIRPEAVLVARHPTCASRSARRAIREL